MNRSRGKLCMIMLLIVSDCVSDTVRNKGDSPSLIETINVAEKQGGDRNYIFQNIYFTEIVF